MLDDISAYQLRADGWRLFQRHDPCWTESGILFGCKNDVKMLKHEDTGWAMTPLLALDLPLSAVVDTLLLPYDYYRSDSNPEDESPRARVLRNEQASGVNNIAPSH